VALTLPSAAPLLAGCSTASYSGIPVATGAADPTLQLLAHRARAGDKQAQLDLGIAFEEGRGVPVDVKRAIKLYRMAASDSGGTMWVYSPPVGNGTKGRVMPVDRGPRISGLAEAKARLDLLTATPEEN
jgi:hypothetical protein